MQFIPAKYIYKTSKWVLTDEEKKRIEQLCEELSDIFCAQSYGLLIEPTVGMNRDVTLKLYSCMNPDYRKE